MHFFWKDHLFRTFEEYVIFQALRNRGAEGASTPPKFSAGVPFLLMSPLNMLFLKEVTKNVRENQQLKSRASYNKT